jgi:hypothetical protein
MIMTAMLAEVALANAVAAGIAATRGTGGGVKTALESLIQHMEAMENLLLRTKRALGLSEDEPLMKHLHEVTKESLNFFEQYKPKPSKKKKWALVEKWHQKKHETKIHRMRSQFDEIKLGLTLWAVLDIRRDVEAQRKDSETTVGELDEAFSGLMKKIQEIEQSIGSQNKHALSKKQWEEQWGKLLSNMEEKEEGEEKVQYEQQQLQRSTYAALRKLRSELTQLLQNQQRQNHWLGCPAPAPQPAVHNEYNNQVNVKNENSMIPSAIILSVTYLLVHQVMPSFWNVYIDLDGDGDTDVWDLNYLFAFMAGMFCLGWAACHLNQVSRSEQEQGSCSDNEPGPALHPKRC